MEIGQSYVFIGQKVKDAHFKNFTYGESYRISSFSELPDSDIYGQDFAIIFENSKWGCISSKFHNYFISQYKFRENQIRDILGPE